VSSSRRYDLKSATRRDLMASQPIQKNNTKSTSKKNLMST